VGRNNRLPILDLDDDAWSDLVKPVGEGGRVVAGLGVAGRDPGTCEDIASAVLAARDSGSPNDRSLDNG
jgi:hypothetical protein